MQEVTRRRKERKDCFSQNIFFCWGKGRKAGFVSCGGLTTADGEMWGGVYGTSTRFLEEVETVLKSSFAIMGGKRLQFGLVFSFLTIVSPYDPKLMLLGMYPNEWKLLSIQTPIHRCLAAFFIIAKTWKQPRCPSMGE